MKEIMILHFSTHLTFKREGLGWIVLSLKKFVINLLPFPLFSIVKKKKKKKILDVLEGVPELCRIYSYFLCNFCK